MDQNLTCTQCGDYYIPGVRSTLERRHSENTARCVGHSCNRTNR